MSTRGHEITGERNGIGVENTMPRAVCAYAYMYEMIMVREKNRI